MNPDSQKSRPAAKPGFTLPELIVVSSIILIFLPFLIPRGGMTSRNQCQVRMKNIALATNLYEGKFKRFPPSCHIWKSGPAENKDGYSFLVDLLPNLEQEAIWKRMDVNALLDKEEDVLEAGGGKLMNRPDECLAVSLPIFRCPNSKTGFFIDETTGNLQAITNYKAVSASTRTAYEVSSRTNLGGEKFDIYGIDQKAIQSDGVMYVGSRTTVAGVGDGVTNTLMLTETEEPIYSRWIVGQECGLYTMPDDTEFLAPTHGLSGIPYIHPTGYTANRYGSESTIPPENRKTNLNRDYAEDPYPWGEAGFRSERYSGESVAGQARFGPSSAHKGVVIHATVDGAVYPISKNIDPAAYFFYTTRNNGDPCPDLNNL